MGNAGTACKRSYQRLGWGGVPDTDRATYFKDQFMCGWYELLCCPSSMGCTVVNFEQKNPNGGDAQYKIKMRLSHSEHVPRYQIHVVEGGRTKQWVVGHMEKTETHLRAKPGEFIRVQVWKLTCNSMVWEERRSALHRTDNMFSRAVKNRPTPSATDMQMMNIAIATQAKIDMKPKQDGERRAALDKNTERWVQSIGVDNRSYKVAVDASSAGDGVHRSMKSMNVMRILQRGKKVCVARKQRFAGTLGKVEQPYLGVQIKPSKKEEDRTANADDSQLQSLLDTQGLLLLLISLAWSEDTMSPERDMTDRFVQAMRADPSEPGSAEELGLSVLWDTDDVKLRLKHVPYAHLHDWGKTHRDDSEMRPVDEESELEDDSAASGEV
eukprot:TRINITY_DN37443_c0_g1_i1.p1 TRINITY_DN37443_c0_g1~~TRINITY_DN37443_c0_g1_i1.p1  ORF type:complete len:382 (+),score=87.21 TRINITY_DN37443_c0_g1_i1:92-1237(+)